MKPRNLIFALVAASLSLPTLAAAQTAVQPPATKPAPPGDLPCLLRMMHLSVLTTKSAADTTKDAAFRERTNTLAGDARRAVYYYVGRLGPSWSSTDRSPEAQVAYKAMMEQPSDQLAQEMSVCMAAAQEGEKNVVGALTPKKN